MIDVSAFRRCLVCGRLFATAAGLSTHAALKHSPDGRKWGRGGGKY